jgi:acylphosphatase
MKRVRVIISGDVQGVGFRTWIKNKAKAINVTGWVKNHSDGSVETVAEGDEEQLKEFVEFCHQGPEVSWVEKVEVVWHPYKDEYMTFEIEY